jgi:putative tryptophan/tyrosine transport system substrate-binding protein
MMGGTDPIKSGLVASLSRPGGNITGVTFIIGELEGKRLDVLLQLAPEATTVGYMVEIGPIMMRLCRVLANC